MRDGEEEPAAAAAAASSDAPAPLDGPDGLVRYYCASGASRARSAELLDTCLPPPLACFPGSDREGAVGCEAPLSSTAALGAL